jgi:hypothetical protein
MQNERYDLDVPFWLRWLMCWGIQESSGRPLYRFKWGEFHWGWGLTLQYSVYHEEAYVRIHPIFFSIHIKTPMLITQGKTEEDWNATYGFTWFCRGIHFNWRSKCKIFNLPWDWTHVRHQVWNGKELVAPAKDEYHPPYSDGRIVEVHPYRYVLKNGTVQDRTATIYGDEREWRWRWFTWLPWPNKISRCIDVAFSDEVGERTGSWKGGTIGCGYEWRNGESMLESLRRMEAERKF